MFKKRCLVCGSTHTKKNGLRKGVQLYKCQDCGYQFRAGVDVSEDALWEAYQQEKQTIKELSVRFGMSVATIKRRLHDIKREWVQPPLSGEGFVHLDVTYWGRSFGVLLALDSQTGKPLYMAFVKNETVKPSPLNSRRSVRPADSSYGVITTLKGSPHSDGRITLEYGRDTHPILLEWPHVSTGVSPVGIGTPPSGAMSSVPSVRGYCVPSAILW